MNSNAEDIDVLSNPISWVGLNVGKFVIDKVLGEGAFSHVYLAKDRENGTPVVFKVSKPIGQVGKICSGQTGFYPTQALVSITGAFSTVEPDAGELLKEQFEKLHASPHKNLISVDHFATVGELSYYQCEYLQGQSLRQAISSKEAGLQTLVDLAQAMDSLINSKFQSHGDLKPENILLTKSGIKLIDPGFFGKLTDKGRALNWAAVTTPEYYPLLQPDDIFAFGVIAWETLMGKHPLPAGQCSERVQDKGRVDPKLLELIEIREATGNFFGSGLLELTHPCQVNSDISPSLGNLLLKLLRLRITADQKLSLDEGFKTFGAISEALLATK